MSRVAPLEPPYEPEVEARLSAMMPPGCAHCPVPYLRQEHADDRGHGRLGPLELSKRLSLTLRDREIVIDRTTARCKCEYEWGVHVAFFAERAGLSASQISSLTCGDATDPGWGKRDSLLIEAVDALHDAADVPDGLWQRLAAEFSQAQLLDLLLLCGWYHAISFAANGARVPLEDGVPRFADVARS